MFHTDAGSDNFGQIAKNFFVGNDGLRLEFYGGSGRANPDGVPGTVHYQSSIPVFGAQASYPLNR
ncbi:hypothetical protein [Acidocella sp.]|uniref:hypothetical protein n=1 Tax=Acidocella sp. TaxID=50710 RepID=UPI0026203A1D|nr:hypothetical protein [Acidocella sp.]MDD2795420.1 hypothetical protein [Acidocella sp.]